METSIIQIILDPSPYLHVFQKYLQKIVFKHITCFINKHDVLNPQQYGFQKGISTAHAILNTVTSTFDDINRKQFTGIFFLDLKKRLIPFVTKIFLRSRGNHYELHGPVNTRVNQKLSGLLFLWIILKTQNTKTIYHFST